MNSYYELQIKINPAIEDIVSDICFENLPCEGIVMAEEAYKDLEMISTTEGTLRVFLTGESDHAELISESYIRNLFVSFGLWQLTCRDTAFVRAHI